MPTAIAVTSADLVLPPTDHQTPTAALLHSPDAQPLDAALADMSVLLEQHGSVIVLYPSTIPSAHERRLHTVRSVLESDRIACLKLDLPPLGVAVLVRQLRQLSICDFSAGVVASAARLLSHYIYAGALLNSVTRLDRVPVSLKSHAKSWVPGSQFGVLANPNPQLIKIGSGELSGPEFGTQLLVAKGQLQSEWVSSALAPAWQVQGLQVTALPADSPAGGARPDWSNSLPICLISPCSTSWFRPYGERCAPGAEENSSVIAAASAPHRSPRPRTKRTRPVS